MSFEFVQEVFGGLGLFLLGMKLMSDGLQAIAGHKLGGIISKVTGNRLLAALTGIVVTFIFQSSSATTVMVVGFVNSGMMTLLQALGVSLGAHVGTTISLWVLTLNITEYGLLVIGLAAFIFLFAKRERPHYIGMVLLGLGLLFFGMELMKDGFAPLRDNESVKALLAHFDAVTTVGFIKAVLISSLITGIIQSSAAMVVIVMSLGLSGIVNFPTAVALVLGSNIGTTVTALIACIGAKRNALRSAIGHSLVSIIGVVAIVFVHGWFVQLCQDGTSLCFGRELPAVIDSPEYNSFIKVAVPFTHTLFNLCTLVLLFPFVPLLEKLLYVLVPKSKTEQGAVEHFQAALDKRLLRTPNVAVEQSKIQILRMGDCCRKMLDDLAIVLANEDRDLDIEDRIFAVENDLDVAQKDISEYVSQMLHNTVTHDVAVTVRRQLRQADEFESVSDYVCTALKAYIKIRNADEDLSIVARKEVLELTRMVYDFCGKIMELVDKEPPNCVEDAHHGKADIDAKAREYRNLHMQRLSTICTSPVKSLVYNDMLMAYRRMTDHLVNIAEAI